MAQQSKSLWNIFTEATNVAVPGGDDILPLATQPGTPYVTQLSGLTVDDLAAYIGAGGFPDIIDTPGVLVEILVPLEIDREITALDTGSQFAADFRLTMSDPGDSLVNLVPFSARSVQSDGTVSAEIASISAIATQTGGTNQVLEALGAVITHSGGVTNEIRLFNSQASTSANVAGNLIGGSFGLIQTSGTIDDFIVALRAGIVQSAGAEADQVFGSSIQMDIDGDNNLVTGQKSLITITNGTNGGVRGLDLTLNLSGGVNSSIFGAYIDLNVTGGTPGAATGLLVMGPPDSADPTIASFQSRKANSYGVYIKGHAAQSQDLLDVVTSANANLFKVAADGDITAAGEITGGLAASVISSSVALTDRAAGGAGTITNAPHAGNPDKWIAINDNGTLRAVPAWNV